MKERLQPSTVIINQSINQSISVIAIASYGVHFMCQTESDWKTYIATGKGKPPGWSQPGQQKH